MEKNFQKERKQKKRKKRKEKERKEIVFVLFPISLNSGTNTPPLSLLSLHPLHCSCFLLPLSPAFVPYLSF